MVVCPEPPPGRPLIYTGDARRFTESQYRLIDVSVWSLLIPNLQYKLTTNVGLWLQALNRPWALSPHLPSCALTYLTTDEVNPAQICRFTPSSNIPNIRPQIDLNWFMSISNTLRKFLLRHLHISLVNRRDVTFQDHDNSP